MTTLDPRALEAATEAVGRHIHYSRQSHNCHRCRRTAEAAITAYLAVTQPTVETAEGLEGLEVGTAIRCNSGRILESFETWEAGIMWSPTDNDGARRSDEVALPARVIWRPHESP